MSSFYTVNTTNAFAALDLSDDGERIRPNTEAPKEEVPEEVVPTPVTPENQEVEFSKRGKGNYRDNRGNYRGRGNNFDNRAGDRFTGGDSPDNRRGGGGRGRGGGYGGGDRPQGTQGPDGVANEDEQARYNGRGRGTGNTRRGGRGDSYTARDGKRIYDKKSSPGQQRKAEDTNPEHDITEHAAADTMVQADAYAEQNEANAQAADKKEETPKITLESYMASLAHVAPTVPDNVPASYNELEREVAEAGFKPMETKKQEIGGKIPSSKKNTDKKQSKNAGQDLFQAMDTYISINPRKDDPRNNRESGNQRRNNQGNQGNAHSSRQQETRNQQVEAQPAEKTGLCKEDFPTLC